MKVKDSPTWLRLKKLAMEPPFRLLVRSVLKHAPVAVSAATRGLWDISERPAYLVGLLFAVRQAIREGVDAISAVEFGVAGGIGLLALQREAAAVEQQYGVRIQVYGFDRGAAGLPDFIGDHRDHPDMWRPGDFPMDESLLKARLEPRTTLILGDVGDTVSSFYDDPQVPTLGFAAFDLDLYSSTSDALRILSVADKRTLQHVPAYFDDIEHARSHRFAGELLAIDEFNERNRTVKIDRWRGLPNERPFPDAPFLRKLFMVHDLACLCGSVLDREPLRRDLIVAER